jgi:uncharacterized protein
MQRGTAIVTGASAGIGAALAHRLAREGFDLLLVARRAEKLDSLAGELRTAHAARTVDVLGLDVTDDDALAKLRAACPDPAVLINNAGVGRFGAADSIPVEEQAQVVRLNCESLTNLTLGYLPGMLERGRGVIVNLASIAGFQPVPFFAVYSASKAYVLSLSEALDEEVRARGVRVISVCPGPVPTEFQQIAGSPDARHTHRWALRTSEQVADQTVRAILRPRRRVIPAWIHSLMWWLQRLTSRDFVIGQAAKGMRKRIDS